MKDESLLEPLRARALVTDEQVAGWRERAELLAAFDAIARDGATAVLKADGARPEATRYTVVVSGGRLGEDYFRRDGGDVAALLADAIAFYRARAWDGG